MLESMCGIFAYMFSRFKHKDQPNVDRYTVHGASGFLRVVFYLDFLKCI